MTLQLAGGNCRSQDLGWQSRGWLARSMYNRIGRCISFIRLALARVLANAVRDRGFPVLRAAACSCALRKLTTHRGVRIPESRKRAI